MKEDWRQLNPLKLAKICDIGKKIKVGIPSLRNGYVFTYRIYNACLIMSLTETLFKKGIFIDIYSLKFRPSGLSS